MDGRQRSDGGLGQTAPDARVDEDVFTPGHGAVVAVDEDTGPDLPRRDARPTHTPRSPWGRRGVPPRDPTVSRPVPTTAS